MARTIARLQEEVRTLERQLRTRMAELEAAERHIARLEEKLLSLKEAKKQLKQLKAEKQALRKSPERKVGQVLLAPYLLPKKLLREVRKRRGEGQSQLSAATAEYQAWFERHRATPEQLEQMRAAARKFTYAPLVSVITPVFDTPEEWLREAVESVRAQAYANWELLLIDDASSAEGTLRTLAELEKLDPRIRVLRIEGRGGISAASNRGLAAAKGEWISLLDHDDVIEPDALFHTVELLQRHPNADLIYSDEDKLTEAGVDAPLFKPDWSPDFFLSCNYISHLTTIRRSLVQEVGGFRSAYDFAQDYDLYLRVIARGARVHHIPRVLYHWRRTAGSTAENIRRKPASLESARAALADQLRQRGEEAHVSVEWNTHLFRIRRSIPEEKRVTIIIPTRDQTELLQRCIASLEEKTAYSHWEIVIVDNDSQSAEARAYLRQTRHRVVPFAGPFNYSAMNNLAVRSSDSPWLLFLNNDIEVVDPEWLTAMVEHVQRPEVGAVGARLLFPDGTVQHAGVVLGVRGIADHAFRGLAGEEPGVGRQLQATRNCSAVTGACLLTRREVFDEVGGFDEERLPVSF
ncbi:MAG TPA: glycosyltransferase, partial [Chthoniobacterales bacterium]|nr:glycosyltransferase [Chthoniobacterales bacterium]